MRIFLTGANGFVGARVARQLLEQGHEVHGLVRPGSSQWRLRDLGDQLALHSGDLANRDRLAHILRCIRPEACIHTAWYAEPGKYLHARANLDCVTMSLSLLEELAHAGCQQVVMTGTCAEYAPSQSPLTEDDPIHPATVYAACKSALRQVGERLAELLGIRFVWARLFYLYGPDEDLRRLLPSVVQALRQGRIFTASSGNQIRDYLHVDDVSRALIALATQPMAGVVNVASGMGVSVRHFLETVARLLGQPESIAFGGHELRGWEPPRLVGDPTRLHSLGWQPHFALVKGLQSCLQEDVVAEPVIVG